jgi:hypothetical protein
MAMHTLSEFRDASPAQKADMMVDGLSYLQSMVNQTTQHLRIYNTWAENMPGLVEIGAADKLQAYQYAVQCKELATAFDLQIAAFINLVNLQKGLENHCITNPLNNEKS